MCLFENQILFCKKAATVACLHFNPMIPMLAVTGSVEYWPLFHF